MPSKMTRSQKMRSPLLLLAPIFAACAKDFEEPEVEAASAGALSIIEPAAGAWLPTGTTAVSGTALSVASLTVNGEAVEVVTGSFETTAELRRGINLIEVVGTEADGDTLMQRHGVIAGDFATPDGAVEDAAVARLNRDGLTSLAEFGASFVDAQTVSKALADAGAVPIAKPFTGTWAEATIEGIDFSAPQITLDPTTGALDITVVLPDMYGEIIWIDFTQDLVVTADEVVITAELTLGAEDGRIVAGLLDPEVTLDGFAYDISLLPSFIEGYVFIDTIQAALEEELVTQMSEMIPVILDETLSTLDFSFSADVLGKPLTATAGFSRADVDTDGIEIGVDIDVTVPGDGTMSYNGYLTTGTLLGTPDEDAEVAMLLSDDLLNRIAFEVWRGGLMEMTLSTEDGSLEPALIQMLKTDSATVTLSAALPPVITQSAAGVLQLQIAELGVVLLTPGGELGEEMVLDVTAFADVSPELADGELSMSLGELDIAISTRSSDWGASTEATSRLVEEMLPLELIPALLSQISFAIPELGGLTIADAVVSRPDAFSTAITLDVEVAQ
jgi:hypothetical protein